MPIHQIETIISMFNNENIPVRFTWTNSQLESKHLKDAYCNQIMEIANNGKNEVIVNSVILEKYLRTFYPNFKYISSTTKCLTNASDIKQEFLKYDLVVLDYNKNKDFDFLNTLSIQDKTKIELLINSYCEPNCPFRKKHYDAISLLNLNHHINLKDYTKDNCVTGKINFLDTLNYSCNISIEELFNYYIANNFIHFKIEGRTFNPCDVIESYVYYLVKPEYQNEIRLQLLKFFFAKEEY